MSSLILTKLEELGVEIRLEIAEGFRTKDVHHLRAIEQTALNELNVNLLSADQPSFSQLELAYSALDIALRDVLGYGAYTYASVFAGAAVAAPVALAIPHVRRPNIRGLLGDVRTFLDNISKVGDDPEFFLGQKYQDATEALSRSWSVVESFPKQGWLGGQGVFFSYYGIIEPTDRDPGILLGYNHEREKYFQPYTIRIETDLNRTEFNARHVPEYWRIVPDMNRNISHMDGAQDEAAKVYRSFSITLAQAASDARRKFDLEEIINQSKALVPLVDNLIAKYAS